LPWIWCVVAETCRWARTCAVCPRNCRSQIEAGGIGLNIQVASIVIIAEPQWKPSTEEQAIARSYRMGQNQPVEVHRLLTEDSVDEYMLAILAHKSAIFDSYIRPSAMKDAAAAAVDTATSSQSVQEEWIIDSERRRLGLSPEAEG